jgi:hypothetical protein
VKVVRAAVAALVLASLAACGTGTGTGTGTESLSPCPSENEGTSCYWDARTRGDGKGASFVVDEFGRVTFTYEREI